MPKARWPVRVIVAAAMIGVGVRAVSSDEMIEKSMPTGALRVAVANTTTMRAAATSLKEATVTGYQTIAEIERLIRAGRIDAIALPAASMGALAAALPGSRILPGPYFTRQAAVAVPPHHEDLLTAASAFVEGAKSSGLLRQVFDANRLKDTPIPDAR